MVKEEKEPKRTPIPISEIAKTLKDNGVTITNKDVIVKELIGLTAKMSVNVRSVEEEIADVESFIETDLTKTQKDVIRKRHGNALDVPKDIRKAIIFSRTCVSHTAKLVADL